MKRFLEAIPIPICGIMLAIVSLGNLLKVVCEKILGLPGLGYIIYTVCGIITVLMLILVLLKIIFCFKMVTLMLENPEMMGIFSAYTLTLMIFAGYLPIYIGYTPAEVLWWIGVLMHYTNMVIFTYKYVIKDFKLPELLPPWYIVYVGFALSGFSASNFAPAWFGIAAFWIGFSCFWIIFFMLIKRFREYPIPRMDEPTLCINAAIGICLTTYVRNFTHPWIVMIAFLFIASLAIWIWLIFKLPKMMKLPFYPTDSAFSFPFVVSAIASLETMNYASQQGIMIGAWDKPLVLLQTAVAVFMVGFAVVRYTVHIYKALRIKNPGQRMMSVNMMERARDMNMHEGMDKAGTAKLGEITGINMTAAMEMHSENMKGMKIDPDKYTKNNSGARAAGIGINISHMAGKASENSQTNMKMNNH